MTPLGALPTAPGCARAYVRSMLAAWNLGHLADMAELVVSEMVTNAVEASTVHSSPLYVSGRMLVIWVRLFSDSFRLVVEVWDEAPGVPVEEKAAPDDERGRGLSLVDALTNGHWGWLPGSPVQPGKCVWAELTEGHNTTARTGAGLNLHGRISQSDCPLPRPDRMTSVTDPALFTGLVTEAENEGVRQLVVGAVISKDGQVLLLRRPEDDFMGASTNCPAAKSKPVKPSTPPCTAKSKKKPASASARSPATLAASTTPPPVARRAGSSTSL